MKKNGRIMLAGLLLALLMIPTVIFAEGMYSTEFYRCIDKTGSLSEAEIQSVDETAMEFMENHQLDCAVAAIPEERLDGMTPEEFARGLYESSHFGYGDTKDGFMCIYVEENASLTIVPMGNAGERISETMIRHNEEYVPTLYEKYGMFGICYGSIRCLDVDLNKTETAEADETVAETEVEKEVMETLAAETLAAETAVPAVLPPWYPEDKENFQFFPDPEAPRVVDMADILSPEAETAIASRIAQISSTYGKDIVVVTDMSTYGLGEAVYAADFYDYNGYGIGEQAEGLCLMICMDPNDRGGWVCATGDETRAIYTEENAERLDDVLYSYLGKGEYDTAVATWVDLLDDFFRTGMALAPSWYPVGGVVADGYYDPNAPLVGDFQGILSEAEKASLEELCKKAADTYGVPVFVHVTYDTLGQRYWDYSQFYYKAMGYPEDGILLVSGMESYGSNEDVRVYPFGKAEERVPEKIATKIKDLARQKKGAYGMVENAMQRLLKYLKNGRTPRGGFYWIITTLLSTLAAFIFGKVQLGKAEATMKVPTGKRTAFSYVDEGSIDIRILEQRRLYSKTERTLIAKPKPTSERSSSSSSHRSSHSSSYSGSSGRTHSGSGRKF